MKRFLVALGLCAGVFATTAAHARSAVATFQGFRETQGGSEIYLLFKTRPGTPRVEPGKAPGSVQVVIPDARAGKRFRFLDTRYFATPVKVVVTRTRGRSLVLDISLKEPATPTVDVREDKGMITVVLSFPPGTPETAPPPRPGAPGSGAQATEQPESPEGPEE